MKYITEAQYNQLCKSCDSLIKDKPNSFERNANSWLNVIREHPIFLKNMNQSIIAMLLGFISSFLLKFLKVL